jgi:diguanylate cyclase (GGDEF)-like protein
MLAVGVWLASVTSNDAAVRAQRDATFQAGLGAAAVSDATAQAVSAMAGLAQGLPVAALVAAPSKCKLTFADLGVFASGHIDIVLPDGRVPCSSIVPSGAPAGATQSGAGWLARPTTALEPGIGGVFTDRLTGERALAVTAPVLSASGKPDAYAVVVLPLSGLAAGLQKTYGGPQHFAFTVRSSTGESLARGADNAKSGLISGSHPVSGLGWVVSAAESRRAALAPTRVAFVRLGALVTAALVLLLGLIVLVNRRIGRPLRRLTAAADQASRHGDTDQVVEVTGPAEVRQLADAFNTMIAARIGYETQLVHHALHDPLTGLPNRALCLDRIGQALHAAAGHPESVAVLSIDLDRFKLINAGLGHRAGDDLLAAVAVRLQQALKADDTLARTGDGFIVCRPRITDSVVAAGIAVGINACLAETFKVAGTDVSLTASIGLAFGRRGLTADELVRDADTAMYSAKQEGGGRFRLISNDLRERSSERLGLEADLREALGRGQLHVEYQPVVNLLSEQIIGVEALLRWTHPVRGPVAPATFIPIAENAGLIGQIGQFVLERACTQAAAWTSAGHQLRVSVNMSGLQLHAPGFAASVSRVLHFSGLDPAQLCLELTETVLMDDAMRGADLLRELKDLGVALSVDDFGTGYSSLAYLQRFPVDELKIDRCFVQSLGHEANDHSLVAAMVAMGHALGLHIVAEGVETPGQQATLLTLGCRSAQGYLFSKPQRPEAISRLLDQARSVGASTQIPAGTEAIT